MTTFVDTSRVADVPPTAYVESFDGSETARKRVLVELTTLDAVALRCEIIALELGQSCRRYVGSIVATFTRVATAIELEVRNACDDTVIDRAALEDLAMTVWLGSELWVRSLVAAGTMSIPWLKVFKYDYPDGSREFVRTIDQYPSVTLTLTLARPQVSGEV